MAKLLDDVLSQEMDRKEFLVRVGAGAMALVGISGMIKGLTGTMGGGQVNGYGSGSYGGVEPSQHQAGSTKPF
ncbi:hypothetical protein EPO04_03565 [Patescibacteria group bacterium]|nr:MAG: hypothetical protein EPO04_03565 [Patescibacteria group bacterium]